jgi:hypothetical protein
MIILTKKPNVKLNGLNLFAGWHHELARRLRNKANAFRPVVFVTEAAAAQRNGHGVLLLPSQSAGKFEGLKRRNCLRMIKEVGAIEVGLFDRRFVEGRFLRSQLVKSWAWTSLTADDVNSSR